MATANAHLEVVEFNLQRLAFGGPVGIGLEAQGDVGLPVDRYVAIPEGLEHKPEIEFEPIICGAPCPFGGAWAITVVPFVKRSTEKTELYFHRGRYWAYQSVPPELANEGPCNIFAQPVPGGTHKIDYDYDAIGGDERKYKAWHEDNKPTSEPPAITGPIPSASTCPEGSASDSALVHYKEVRWHSFATSKGGRGSESYNLPFPVKIRHRNPPKVTVNDLGHFIDLNKRVFGAHPKALNGVAGRLFAYMIGFMSATDECEITFVKCEGNPAASPEEIDHVRSLIANDNFCSQVLTMCAARTISWRQTGHCTGGNVAVGYVHKVLEQSEWTAVKGRVDVADTDLFYNTFHAVNNRSMMVVLCPDRYETTAVFKTALGVPVKKRAEASVNMRLEAKSGVAGTKLLIDSMTVVKTAAVEGMIVTFPSLDAISRLVGVCRIVSSNGLLTGTACRFWVRYNAFGMKAVPVDQRDPTLHEICRYASIYAVSYMQGSTMAKAKSLINFAKQNPDEGFRKLWIELRKQSSGLKVSEATALIHLIQARRGSINSANFLSESEALRAQAAAKVKEVLVDIGINEDSIRQYNALSDEELERAKANIAAAEALEQRVAAAAERAQI